MSGTPRPWVRQHRNSSKLDTNCCIQRGRNHGGQTVARLQSPEGAIVGISYIPVFHDEN